jgi:hypothetical protein
VPVACLAFLVLAHLLQGSGVGLGSFLIGIYAPVPRRPTPRAGDTFESPAVSTTAGSASSWSPRRRGYDANAGKTP